MACDGIGPSATCLSLCSGAGRAGYDTTVFANRLRHRVCDIPVHLALPGPLARLPYRFTASAASQLTERAYLRAIRPDDIAYLWPGASLHAHQVLRDRGHFIVLEGINTRMAQAKPILDEAYDAFGAVPAHGITQARIDEEEAKYALADSIFAPSRNVERALEGSALEGRFISASYGVDTFRARRTPRDHRKGRLTFLFCGHACVRKGIHHLLDAWSWMQNSGHRLQIVGRVEPVIAERYSDLLSSDSVETVGFVRDVDPYFAAADVFVLPSLEEGDPLVTYEAALHGLPIIATPMGAGRMGEDGGAVRLVPPADVAHLTDAMERLSEDIEARTMLSACARQFALLRDWDVIGARRAAQLAKAVASTT